ncbi:MAG: hypothetical protein AAGJ35_15850, partial [Myxococcota bacterium]
MKPPDQSEKFDHFLKLIGRINYSWTNTESLLIHLIAGLVHTDKPTAVVIFLTLNTTRARVDLVERLAKLDRTPVEQKDAILPLTRKFVKLSSLRNHYNHSIYSFDPVTGATRTIKMRIADRKDTIKVGQMSDIGSDTVKEIETALEDIAQLN